MTQTEHVAPAAVCGIGFLAAGILLLLQELHLLTLSWTLLLPALLVVLGVVTLVTGLVGAHRSRPD